MNKFINTYLKIIYEDISPIYYKNTFIDFSYLTQVNHFNKRIADKNRNIYTDDEILTIIKAGIDKFINNNEYKKYRDNPGQINAKCFTIISKSHDKIKIKAKLWKNGKKEKIKAIINDKPLVDYVCRLQTLLTKDMFDYKDDIPLIVENNEDEIPIYVD